MSSSRPSAASRTPFWRTWVSEGSGPAHHASCVTPRAAGAGVLTRAQAEGAARSDPDGDELFALVAMVACPGDQPSLAPRSARPSGAVAGAILTGEGSGARDREGV